MGQHQTTQVTSPTSNRPKKIPHSSESDTKHNNNRETRTKLSLIDIQKCFSLSEGTSFISTQARNFLPSSMNQYSILNLAANEKLVQILSQRILQELAKNEQTQDTNNTATQEITTSMLEQKLEQCKEHAKERVFSLLESDDVSRMEESRAFACFLGLMIGDAMGSPLEFSPCRFPQNITHEKQMLVEKAWKNDPEFFELTSMSDKHVWTKPNYNRFELKPGQYTDDSSMALCVLDTFVTKVLDEIYLKECQKDLPPSDIDFDFNGRDMRLRFLNWWYFGYNNAFGKDETHTGAGSSCGLGGNIKQSLVEFMKNPSSEVTLAGDLTTSGNGSIMRNAPIPIVCLKHLSNNNSTETLEKVMKMAYKQSKTTHQGEEAAELCRLLTLIVVKAVKADASLSPLQVKQQIFDSLHDGEFVSTLPSVNCLVRSQVENNDVASRNWNWLDVNYTFCKDRIQRDPGYCGSYAMDAMAMALHNIYYTDNFVDAILLTTNMRGDSDSVGAVVGQIAGAIYGLRQTPRQWLETILQWDYNRDILLRLSIIYSHDLS
ncbi:hypothetical protein FDP41_013639 [Naegleria fowleri]|uniref:ADP-ribosylglycohydrolase n=1 Tax=Naegleria fowleri TaxID=5763 RepID=A0A6A5C4M7_NAEFO|nr:uncharacterized protein FDP41_013639 [Naegleria fowleri]KAF0980425.1 hypothetical protein FDP41_013639 [Naegleria fowleri]